MVNLDKYEAEWLKYIQTSDSKKPFVKFIMDEIESKMNSDEKINFAFSLCPDFDTYENDMVQIPIIEEPSIITNNSVYPSEQEKLKIITFRKNFKNKSWEFYNKNF
ncbi:hypothetical protein QLS91_08020 [Flavobacterium sp. LB2P84]|uniref:hypothetical protein n=1 Tax=Flavobacterium yafengii TaxID=3041253 RepID=UPI0024A96856|nr:hypothetical protein [Flavobacterium yafengii]MDI6033018.1 hypothetical protein [Flavobacterium yafengii]